MKMLESDPTPEQKHTQQRVGCPDAEFSQWSGWEATLRTCCSDLQSAALRAEGTQEMLEANCLLSKERRMGRSQPISQDAGSSRG